MRWPNLVLLVLFLIIAIATFYENDYVAIFSGAKKGEAFASRFEKANTNARALNIYSSRNENRELFDKFTEETGIQINIRRGATEELLQRIENDKYESDADIFLASGVSSLGIANKKALLQWVPSRVLEASVPYFLHSKDKDWYALSKRIKVIFYSKERVEPQSLSTYQDLADSKWKGRVLSTPARDAVNISLIAAMVAAEDREKTIEWVKGMILNFAREPQGSDVDQLRAIAAGKGDVTIADYSAYGRLLASEDPKDQEIAEKIGVFIPNQEGGGAYADVTGGGAATVSKKTDNALKLLTFLASKEGQESYANAMFECPVVAAAKVERCQNIKIADHLIDKITKNTPVAMRMAAQLGWK